MYRSTKSSHARGFRAKQRANKLRSISDSATAVISLGGRIPLWDLTFAVSEGGADQIGAAIAHATTSSSSGSRRVSSTWAQRVTDGWKALVLPRFYAAQTAGAMEKGGKLPACLGVWASGSPSFADCGNLAAGFPVSVGGDSCRRLRPAWVPRRQESPPTNHPDTKPPAHQTPCFGSGLTVFPGETMIRADPLV